MSRADTFEQSLKDYDPLLQLRWGPAVKRWVIERKGKISPEKMGIYASFVNRPDVTPMDIERFLSAKRGCDPVLAPLILGNYVFKELWANDLQVHGTEVVDRYFKRLDEQKARRRADGEAASRTAADAIEYMNRKDVTSNKVREEVLEAAFGTKPVAKKPKKGSAIVSKLGKPPKWVEKEAATIGA